MAKNKEKDIDDDDDFRAYQAPKTSTWFHDASGCATAIILTLLIVAALVAAGFVLFFTICPKGRF